MNLFHRLFGRLSGVSNRSSRATSSRSQSPRSPRRLGQSLEALESRHLMASDVLPVLMVISDVRDFYYTEYHDTRVSIEAAGLEVQVAARTISPSTPHLNSGQGAESGVVVPDIALADVDPDDYSAVVFVGGWGSSMYQYAFSGDYYDNHYDGDLATKQIVNNLINEFVADDKYVTAICHGVTVLAWARVDGASPLDGKVVSVPYIGSPGVYYQGIWYGHFALGQYEQVVDNGGIANTVSGQYGNPNTVADDVVVDGRVITAENYDAAAYFGQVIATHVLEWHNELNPPPPDNSAPIAQDANWQVQENAAAGTVVGTVVANDADAGQSLTFAIVGGNASGAFAIDPATGEITVANPAALDFETQSQFVLDIQVTDSGTPALNDLATVTIDLLDLLELPPASAAIFNGDLYVQGTAGDDTIYLWTGAQVAQTFVWINGVQLPAFQLAEGARVILHAGSGNDRVAATDLRRTAHLYGEAGHDLLVGSGVNDLLDGGAGVDRLWGGLGDDVIYGGDGNDFLNGREGNDVLDGGAGNDQLDGGSGDDLMVGGTGSDRLWGDVGNDSLYGGTPDQDDGVMDVLVGKAGADYIAVGALDDVYSDLDDTVEYL